MRIGFGLDPGQGLSEEEMAALAAEAASLGYASAWTPAGGDGSAFERCVRWHEASGLPVGIAVVPASAQPPEVYAERAARTAERTGGAFTLGVGSGALEHPASSMPEYIDSLRRALPSGLPLFVAALGPRMLAIAGELADGVSLNWCTAAHVAWSRERVADAASRRDHAPVLAEYIRVAVDPDESAAVRAAAGALRPYALGAGGYRRHFERMGFGAALRELEGKAEGPGAETLAGAVTAAGTPGATRARFERLAAGLDLAIVRLVVTARGDVASARRALRECAPG